LTRSNKKLSILKEEMIMAVDKKKIVLMLLMLAFGFISLLAGLAHVAMVNQYPNGIYNAMADVFQQMSAKYQLMILLFQVSDLACVIFGLGAIICFVKLIK